MFPTRSKIEFHCQVSQHLIYFIAHCSFGCLITAFATASVFIVIQIKLVVVIDMSGTSEKLENIVAETLFPYTKHFIAE